MIQPLRTIHYRTFAALAVLLPVILLVGIRARQPEKNRDRRTPELPSTAYLLRESNGLWAQNVIDSKFYGRVDRPRDVYVALTQARPLNKPDVLVYWAPTPPQGNSLPPDALLVGPYEEAELFLLPLDSRRNGYLILYSLGHQVVLDRARVETLP